MPRSELSALRLLSRGLGVETAHVDGLGRRVEPGAETLLGLVNALGADTPSVSAAPRTLERTMREHAERLCPPVIVARPGRELSFDIQCTAAQARGRITVRMRTEEGHEHEARATCLATRAMNTRIVVACLRAPVRLPMGYHRLKIRVGRRVGEAHVVCAPARCWSPDEPERALTLFAPTYALHSAHDAGIGTLGELRQFMDLARDNGCGSVGTLPLLAAFNDVPYEPCPYAPVSRRLFNELMLDTGDPGLGLGRARASGAPRGGLVEYDKAWRRLVRLIQPIADKRYNGPEGERRQNRDARSNPLVHQYALFRAAQLDARDGRVTARRLTLVAMSPSRRARYRLFLFAQLAVQRQLGRLSEHPCGLYLDLPVGTHALGFDVWSSPGLFAHTHSVGAPPDALFTGGQDWAFPPILPESSRADGHSMFVGAVRAHLRYARALRLDHVMALHRLYWIPRGAAPSEGAYVRNPAPELAAIVALESHRAGARIIGEDLGTVPAAVRTLMHKSGMLGMCVAQFEIGGTARTFVPDPGPGRIVCLNTHDTATWGGYYSGSDAGLRLRLGHATDGDVKATRARAARMRTLARRVLSPGRSSPLPARAAGELLLERLARSSSPMVLVNLEDLLGVDEPQNVPGIAEGYPNWRRRLPVTVEALRGSRGVTRALGRIVRARGVQPAGGSCR